MCRILLNAMLLLVNFQIYSMMPSVCKCPRRATEECDVHQALAQLNSQEAGLLNILRNPDSPVRATLLSFLLSFLSAKDIVHLRKTCHALQFAWDHNCEIYVHGAKRVPSLVAFVQRVHADNPIKLNFMYCNLNGELPAGIEKLRQLKRLDLGNNHLSKEAAIVLSQCTGLQELVYYKIGELPEEIQKLQQLKKLVLSNDHHLSPNSLKLVCKCTGLEELYLHECNLEELPAEIQNLQQLKKLDLSSNELSQGALTLVCKYMSLEELYLGFGIKEMPEEIQDLQQLKLFSVSNTSLDELISQDALKLICKCTKLKELHLWRCLSELPGEIQKLQQLKKLDLSSNELSQDALKLVCKCTGLEELVLHECHLSELPAEIQNLLQLKKLYLCGNKFTAEKEKRIRLLLPNTKIEF